MKDTKPYTDPRVGRRVCVTAPGRYGDKCLGQEGVIRAVYDTEHVAVDLDFVVNPGSKNGYFYFKLTELDVVLRKNNEVTTEEKGEETMNPLTNYINVAEVQFLNDNHAFRTIECANYDPGLAVNQLCVVKAASHGFGLAEVVGIKDEPAQELRCEIVAGVNTIDYDNRVAHRARAAELKAKMQERAKRLQDIILYKTLAKEDPEMAQLLQDFETLGV